MYIYICIGTTYIGLFGSLGEDVATMEIQVEKNVETQWKLPYKYGKPVGATCLLQVGLLANAPKRSNGKRAILPQLKVLKTNALGKLGDPQLYPQGSK